MECEIAPYIAEYFGEYSGEYDGLKKRRPDSRHGCATLPVLPVERFVLRNRTQIHSCGISRNTANPRGAACPIAP